jgi:ectoine hydroxylase-related dioxygenase (phytanoyl-CoA dioxygenase family)
MLTSESIVDEVNKNGFCILKEFLSDDALNAIESEGKWFFANNASWYKKAGDEHGPLATIFPPLIPKEEVGRLKKTWEVFSQPLFQQMTTAYLGPGAYVDAIIFHTQHADPKPITEWHADQQNQGLFSFKFMLYFNDVNQDNGAFSYVPTSHLVVRKIIARAKEQGISNTKAHHFEQIRQMAKDLKLDDCVEFLRPLSTHIKGDYESDNKYSLNAPKGSIIVFDPKGVHRGGVVSQGERRLVRLHCFQPQPLSWKSKMKRVLTGNLKPEFFAVGPSKSGGRASSPVKEYG